MDKESTLQLANDGNYLKSGELGKIKKLVNNEMSEKGKAYVDSLLGCFNKIETFREYSAEIDTFYFDHFKAFALGDIYAIESCIVNSEEITESEKTVLISMSYTIKCFVDDFEIFTNFILENYGINLKSASGLFKNIWKAVKKVVSAVVSVAVSVVVNTVSSIVGGWVNTGQLSAPLCAAGGVIKGFILGLSHGIECESFDFDCILDGSNIGVC